MKTMNPFRVWVRPLGGICRVRVDGRDNAGWLLDRLADSFIFKNSEPVRGEGGTSFYTFLVPYNSQTTHSTIARLLAKTPEVTLSTEPA